MSDSQQYQKGGEWFFVKIYTPDGTLKIFVIIVHIIDIND